MDCSALDTARTLPKDGTIVQMELAVSLDVIRMACLVRLPILRRTAIDDLLRAIFSVLISARPIAAYP
jgi:hypothetical protein